MHASVPRGFQSVYRFYPRRNDALPRLASISHPAGRRRTIGQVDLQQCRPDVGTFAGGGAGDGHVLNTSFGAGRGLFQKNALG